MSDTELRRNLKLAPSNTLVRRSTESDLGPWVWPFTEEQKNAMVDAHNDLRRIVEPGASDMMKMYWDEELALLAQNWSSGCVFQHPTFPIDYGQNLATHSDIVDAIYAWYSEHVYYDYETASCDPGKVCGHYTQVWKHGYIDTYTQVVWATTSQVGCGTQDCGAKHVTTCNYRVAGNTPGQQPYQSGYPCSQCTSPSWCEDKLCKSGPYNPDLHCCDGQECATNVTDGSTCECICFADRGDKYSCGFLFRSSHRSNNINEKRRPQHDDYQYYHGKNLDADR
uniref:Peptidase inhibitor 16-like n=1 Tax=Saccoglossus kowalevskii TaxID=10224 RepID=A0ABM0MZ63_SACKO|nr:PREDICTED: peptidase inhibitor 16-like [Saccoglossus kowalevskii]